MITIFSECTVHCSLSSKAVDGGSMFTECTFCFKGYLILVCNLCFCSQVVVCAAIFRVLGQEVAELPLVATDKDCQGQVI